METRPVPTISDDEVLVKVLAVGICAGDAKCFAGAPYFWGLFVYSNTYETLLNNFQVVILGHSMYSHLLYQDTSLLEKWCKLEKVLHCQISTINMLYNYYYNATSDL